MEIFLSLINSSSDNLLEFASLPSIHFAILLASFFVALGKYFLTMFAPIGNTKPIAAPVPAEAPASTQSTSPFFYRH